MVTEHTGVITISNVDYNVTQLKTINAATTGDIILQQTGGPLSGSAADLVLAFAGTITEHTGTVEITGTYDSAQLKTINTATTGQITLANPNVDINGSSANLAAAFAGSVTQHLGDVEITNNDYSTSDLATINSATDGTLTLGAYNVALSGTSDQVAAALAGTFASTISGTVTLSDSHTLDELKAINGKTSGAITLNDISVDLSGNGTDVAAALHGFAENSYAGDITLSTSATITEINAIDTVTTGNITLHSAVSLNGSSADVASTVEVLSGYAGNVTLSDPHTLAQLRTINNSTLGNITLNDSSVTLSGTAEHVSEALDGFTTYTGPVTLSSGHNLNQLETISTATSGQITLNTYATALTGTSSAIADAMSGDLAETYTGTVTITNTDHTLDQLKTINNADWYH